MISSGVSIIFSLVLLIRTSRFLEGALYKYPEWTRHYAKPQRRWKKTKRRWFTNELASETVSPSFFKIQSV